MPISPLMIAPCALTRATTTSATISIPKSDPPTTIDVFGPSMAVAKEIGSCAAAMLQAGFTSNRPRATHIARLIVYDLGSMAGWPMWVRSLLRQAALRDGPRFALTLWLLGNGASPSRIAGLLVGGEYLSDARARDSVRRILETYRNGAVPKGWRYNDLTSGVNGVPLGSAPAAVCVESIDFSEWQPAFRMLKRGRVSILEPVAEHPSRRVSSARSLGVK